MRGVPAGRTRGTPLWISGGEEPAIRLERVMLGKGHYSEAWLQQLIFDQPDLLPVGMIEPGFGTLIAAAREIRCGHGYIDNLYVTPAGDIVLVETKLWANAQPRREVVAQALDYVAALTAMDHGTLEQAVAQGDGWRGDTLYDLVRDHPEAPEELEFVDAITHNLRRGRMLVLVVGEGIRKEAEALASLLQNHAGAHFTFALVELAAWRNPVTGDMMCVPDTLARTVMIERGVVVIQDGAAKILAPSTAARAPKPTSLTDVMFYERLAKVEPELPGAIKAFLALVEPLGVYPEIKASLNLRVEVAGAAKPVNLGYIAGNGQLWTNPLAGSVPADLAMAYNMRLAALIGGTVAPQTGPYVTTNGKSAPRIDALLPAHAEGWATAIRNLLDDLARHQPEVAA